MKKQEKPIRKPARHHWFLGFLFAVIFLLVVVAVILQRSTNLDALAGEAIRQRVTETKQLALTEDQIKVSQAVQQGKEKVFIGCPLSLSYAAEQHWQLKEGWKLWPLRSVDAKCVESRVFCYYADSDTEINRADQVVTYLDVPKVGECEFGISDAEKGCYCDLN